MTKKIKLYIMLYVNFFIFTLTTVFARFAANYPIFSFNAAALYGLAFFSLGVYAIVWQQILKHIPLNIAYTNKVVTIIINLLWGVFLFQEHVTANMVLGVVVAMGGVLWVVMHGE
jgi:drug/metabolite transporter (DMT)-like permease